MLYSLSVNCQVGGFLNVLWFPPPPPSPSLSMFHLTELGIGDGSKDRQHSKFPINHIEQIMKDMT